MIFSDVAETCLWVMLKLGFMASYNGSSMLAILQAIENGLEAAPAVLIYNNREANARKYAEAYRMPAYHLSSKTHEDPEDLDRAICNTLKKHQVDLVILSGYMKKLGPKMLMDFRNRILNIHPSLLPRFGGQGMYGDHVHKAVLQSGEKETGATVHIVTGEYDQGPILNQRKVPLTDHESVDSIREKVQQIEPALYLDTLESIISGKITLPNKDIRH